MAQRLRVDPKAPKPKLIWLNNNKYWIVLDSPEPKLKLNLSLPTWSVATYVLLLLISIWLFCG